MSRISLACPVGLLVGMCAGLCSAEKVEKKPLPARDKPVAIKEAGSLFGGRLGAAIDSVAVSPTQKLIAAGGELVRIWDEKGGEIVIDLKGFEFGVWRLAFSADGAYLAVMARRQRLKIFQVKDWKLCRQADMTVRDLTFLHKRNVLVVEYGNEVRFYDVEKGGITAKIDTGLPEVFWIAVSADDLHLAVAGSGGRVQLYDLKEMKLLHTFEIGKGPMYGIALSDDGKYLAVGADEHDPERMVADTKIKVWDVKERKLFREWGRGSVGSVAQLVFLPQSHQLAVPGGYVRIYDVPTGRETTTLQTHSGTSTNCVAFYGEQAVAGCRDGTVRWWKSVKEEAKPKAP
jgi:WD40 repeat protein